jgi:hypothetical protein
MLVGKGHRTQRCPFFISYCQEKCTGGWPIQAAFWLEWGSSTHGNPSYSLFFTFARRVKLRIPHSKFRKGREI